MSTFDTNVSNAIAPTLVNADTSRVSGGGAWSEPATDGGVSADPNDRRPDRFPGGRQPRRRGAAAERGCSEPARSAGQRSEPARRLHGVSRAAADGRVLLGSGAGRRFGHGRNAGWQPDDERVCAGAGYRWRASPTDGTPDPASGGPIEVTGAVGQDVKLGIGNPSVLVKIGKPSYSSRSTTTSSSTRRRARRPVGAGTPRSSAASTPRGMRCRRLIRATSRSRRASRSRS